MATGKALDGKPYAVLFAGLAVLAGVAGSASADEEVYSFFKYGEDSALYGHVSYDAWLAANDLGNDGVSTTFSIQTGAMTGKSVAARVVEARTRTWQESSSRALRSDKKGLEIIFR